MIKTDNDENIINEDPIDEFETHIHEDLLNDLEEIRDNLLRDYGFYFDYEDVYLKHPNEKTITIF